MAKFGIALEWGSRGRWFESSHSDQKGLAKASPFFININSSMKNEEVTIVQEMTHRHTRELDIFCKEHHDNCTLCNTPFSDGDTAHLGYIDDSTPAFLCDKCSNHLVETVVRYYWEKREYDVPEANDKLWRYMDLSKLISLISKRELFLASASSFSDPFEGAKGVLERKKIWDNYYRLFFRHALLTVPGADPNRYSEIELEKEINRLMCELGNEGIDSRKHTFISCWHLSEYESEAMWKLYSKDTTNAVVVQTTFNRLYQSLGRDPYISIGKVKYVDFLKHFSPINGSFWYKQKCFEHEREVRVIAHDHSVEEKPGLYHAVDIDLLIENIYVSPYAPQWFFEVVQSILEKYGLDKKILHSQMNAIPFY